jgi:hypothetical protein
MDSFSREAGDDLTAAPPGWVRRHGERRILSEHRCNRVHVAALPGVDLLLDDHSRALVTQRPEHGLLALLGHTLIDRVPSALQNPVHPRYGRLERLRRLLGGETEYATRGAQGAGRTGSP